MPLGDSDIASGLFFADFGVPVAFGLQTTKGNFDAPGKVADFGGGAGVMDVDPSVEIAAGAFAPMPVAKSKIVVGGVGYVLQGPPKPVGDGATVVLMLRAL